jgi:hypothetical protein
LGGSCQHGNRYHRKEYRTCRSCAPDGSNNTEFRPADATLLYVYVKVKTTHAPVKLHYSWIDSPSNLFNAKSTPLFGSQSNVGDTQLLRLQAIVLASPLLGPILHRWDEIALPDSWLVAGAIAQTVWNHACGLSPTHGIADIDLVYFDPSDLSPQAEADHASRIQKAFTDLPVWLDVKNEARVHLWYQAKFGYSIAPYISTADAITTFPTTATAVGLRCCKDGLELYAPYGISDLLGAIVRPNKKQITREIYASKVARWTALWPRLTIIDWDRNH